MGRRQARCALPLPTHTYTHTHVHTRQLELFFLFVLCTLHVAFVVIQGERGRGFRGTKLQSLLRQIIIATSWQLQKSYYIAPPDRVLQPCWLRRSVHLRARVMHQCLNPPRLRPFRCIIALTARPLRQAWSQPQSPQH